MPAPSNPAAFDLTSAAILRPLPMNRDFFAPEAVAAKGRLVFPDSKRPDQ
jgi:hypothetical protein